jgi:hypothetical protein
MTVGEHADPNTGSMTDLSTAYIGNLDTLMKGCEPALKGVGRWNLELLALTTRRSQAWFGIPLRLGQCRLPLDVVNVQLRFWQTLASDYWEAFHRLVAVWGACAILPRLNGLAERDYITLQEPDETSRTPKRSDRKAA